jgi:hypothetical protein
MGRRNGERARGTLPPSYEKQLSTAIDQFLWAGGTEKEQRALCIKARGEGGLSIPHLQSRLSAPKCMWIQRMQEENQGVFSLAFQNTDIKIDWMNKASFKTPFPKIQKRERVSDMRNNFSRNFIRLSEPSATSLFTQMNTTEEKRATNRSL